MADVHVALWVRLDAKPGKEKEVADFLRAVWPSCSRSQQPRPGLPSRWDRQPSESSMPFPTKPAARHTFRVAWPRP